jgi:hypothetical protein
MPGVIEPILGLEWIFDLLAADSTLLGLATGGVWSEMAPASAGFPRVVVSSQGGGMDLRSDNGAELVWAEPLYVVKASDKGSSYARISPIAARIYAVINNTEGTTSEGRIVSCTRDLSFLQPEGVGEIQYRNIVQQFRVQAYANPD